MTRVDRRAVVRWAGAATLLAGSGVVRVALAQAAVRIVIVGGGAAGATAAHYLRRQIPNSSVTLIQPAPQYVTGFFSNHVLGGMRTMEQLTHSYTQLRQLGVTVVHDVAVDVDATKKSVTLISGSRLPYDRLILAPGVDLKFDAIEGYARDGLQAMPHAWRAGQQTVLLKSQLDAMPAGGVVVMAVPPDPYSCPPGPYERACLIANYLKTQKPGSKLIVFDAKRSFSKQAVFEEAFQKYYTGIVELNLSTEIDDFTVTKVDAATRTLITKGGIKTKAAVANVIPPQRAGGIAFRTGCAKGDWCPVSPQTFASTEVADVYVIGDAAVATDMPKSAFSANNQAKLVANVLANELAGRELFPSRLRNTCWSVVAPDDSIKIGANYSVGERDGVQRLIAFDGFVSEPGESVAERSGNYQEALGWYSAITADMFATA